MRRIIQLITLTEPETWSNSDGVLGGIRKTKFEFVALCDDGTIWYRENKK